MAGTGIRSSIGTEQESLEKRILLIEDRLNQLDKVRFKEIRNNG